MRNVLFTFVMLLLLLNIDTAHAQEIFSYIDEEGTVHFTDQPKPGWKRVIIGANGEITLAGKSGPRVFVPVGSNTPYSELINKASGKYKLDGNLIASVIKVESAFDARAVSKADAKGLMQLIDATASQYGVTDPFDPAQNIDAGSRHLRNLMNVYAGDLKLALAAYNAGQGAVRRHGGVPPYSETRRYIEKVAKEYGKIDTVITDSELANSYVAARILARGDRFLYRYETRNGVAFSEVAPKGRNFVKIDLLQ